MKIICQYIPVVLLLLLVSCAGPQPRYAQLPEDDYSYDSHQDELDKECSYFYFLWGRASELDANFEEALEAYEKAIVCDSKSEYVARRLAALLLRMNRKQQALTYIEKLIDAKPGDKNIRVFQAELYASMGDFEKAQKIYIDLLDSDESDTSVMLHLGKLYLNNLDYTEAREVFERIVKIEPDSFVSHYYLAKLYRELKFYTKAFASYNQALALNWSTQLALEIADLYRDQKMYDEAISLYRKIIKDDVASEIAGGRLVSTYLEIDNPERALDVLKEMRQESMDSQKVDFTIGRIFMEQKKFKEAIALFSEMMIRDPELEVAKSLLALAYYENGDRKEAIDILMEVVPEDRGYEEAQFMLVKIYSDDGDYESAIALIRNAINESGESIISYYTVLASLYEENKQIAEAEDIYEEAIRRFADLPDIYFKYGMFLERIERQEEGLLQVKKALELDPEDPYALNYIGYTWADQGVNLEQAKDYIEKAMLAKPDDPYIRDSLGWVHYQLGDFKQAVVELEKAAELVPDDPTINEHLGDAYLADNNLAKAADSYKQSLHLQNNQEGKDRLQKKIEALNLD